jgi:5-methylcytosine-specific restriction endonuclease McrA
MHRVDYRSLSDAHLLARLRELAARERAATADFMACLAEADRRTDAITGQGYSTLFDFCVRDLKLAESTAYKRVKAARLVRSRPEILSRLADGSINVSILSLISTWLEKEPALLERAAGKTKREVEALIAELGGAREIPDRIRPLGLKPPAYSSEDFQPLLSAPEPPAQPAAPTAVKAPPPPAAAPIERRMEFRFAAGQPFVQAVERLRALLWHKFPSGRLEDVLLEAANHFISRRDPARELKRRTVSRRTTRRSRRIPASIRRDVWRRDEARCVFSGAAGRCGEKRGLEIDHVVPWALGGRSDESSNLRLLCRAHNQSEARRVFGDRPTLPGENPVDKSRVFSGPAENPA